MKALESIRKINVALFMYNGNGERLREVATAIGVYDNSYMRHAVDMNKLEEMGIQE